MHGPGDQEPHLCLQPGTEKKKNQSTAPTGRLKMMSLTLPSKSLNVSLLLKTTEQSHTTRFLSENKVHEGHSFAWSKLSISTWHLIERIAPESAAGGTDGPARVPCPTCLPRSRRQFSLWVGLAHLSLAGSLPHLYQFTLTPLGSWSSVFERAESK